MIVFYLIIQSGTIRSKLRIRDGAWVWTGQSLSYRYCPDGTSDDTISSTGPGGRGHVLSGMLIVPPW